MSNLQKLERAFLNPGFKSLQPDVLSGGSASRPDLIPYLAGPREKKKNAKVRVRAGA
jgi:hypothetical protein